MKYAHWRILIAVCFTLGALALFAPAAEACCTALPCPYCVSSSNNCVCAAQTPVCNLAGCNCNKQCGEWSVQLSPAKCIFNPTCSTADAQARFDSIDANHNGKISKDELTAYLAAQPDWLKNTNRKSFPSKLRGADAKHAAVVAYGFKKMDKNGNGAVSPAEFDSGLATKTKK